MQQITIQNEVKARELILKELKSLGYQWHTIIDNINKGRYNIVLGNPNIAILLKSEPFFNFGDKFGAIGERGVGDSINCKDLKTFIEYDVKLIYTMFRDGKIYYIRLQDFLENSHKWTNKEGKEVRSISIQRYKRVNGE